jgi:hypothetical protein
VRANLFAALIGMLCVAGCGGGSFADGGSGGGGTTPTGANVQAIIVDSGPSVIASSDTPAINTAYTTVTVCSPGSTSNCQTIDHIQVDTGSSGLRILAAVLTITLPLQANAGGLTLAECTQFVDGSSWGPIRQADVKIGGETALQQEVQVIGDAAYTTIPSSCSGSSSNAENTVTSFGANGILGVGPFIADCGPACTVQGGTTTAVYYTCPTATTCSGDIVPEAMQVSNPVAAFATDNNGVIIQLPAVATAGSGGVSGSMIFGIGTQSNNGLGSAKVLMLDANGSITTTYTNNILNQSFIDSGSNGYFFPDPNSTITPCTVNVGFYCPSAALSLSGVMTSPVNGTSVTVPFTVTSADALFSSGIIIAAASSLAGNSASADDAGNGSNDLGSTSFDWGLPFYFGRSVYTAIETRNTSGGVGPYFAF